MKINIIAWKPHEKTNKVRCNIDDPDRSEVQLQLLGVPGVNTGISCKSERHAEELKRHFTMVFEAGRSAQREALRVFIGSK
jgi:hypothetical protein